MKLFDHDMIVYVLFVIITLHTVKRNLKHRKVYGTHWMEKKQIFGPRLYFISSIRIATSNFTPSLCLSKMFPMVSM